MAAQLEAASSTPSSERHSLPSSPLSALSKSPSLPSSPVGDVTTMTDSPTPATTKHATAPTTTANMDVSHRYPSPSASSLSSVPPSSGAATPTKRDTQPIDPDLPLGARRSAPTSTSTGEPPKKRRKTANFDPKERTTEYLDLESVRGAGTFDSESERKLNRLVQALRKRKKIAVIAGAGISVSAGIPDFRSKQGLFATLPSEHKIKGSGKHLFDASVYKHDDTTQSFHRMVCDLDAKSREAQPTEFHHMLASLAAEDRLLRLYSQNVDGIDTRMPPLATNIPLNTKGPWPKTIQLHGSVSHMNCSKCGDITPFESDLFVDHQAPLCRPCQDLDAVRTAHAGKRSHGVGRLRPRMVLYNEYNPDEEAIGRVSSFDLKKVPDAVIVVGTSLKIPGVRRLVKELTQATRSKRGGFTAWVNLDSEPQHNDFKDCWDMVVRGKSDDIAHFVQLPHWNDPNADRTAILSEEDEKLRAEYLRRDKVEIQLPTLAASDLADSEDAAAETQVDKVQGIPTPSASPRMPAQNPKKSIKLSKTKQSKLSFGRTPATADGEGAATTTTTAAKSKAKSTAKVTKKAPVRKVGRPSKKAAAAPPKNALTQTFKTSKSAVASAGKPKKDNHVKAEPASDDPSLHELPPLRPQRLESRRSMSYTPERSDASSDLSPAPSSPTQMKKSSPTNRTKLPESPGISSPSITVQTSPTPLKPLGMDSLVG